MTTRRPARLRSARVAACFLAAGLLAAACSSGSSSSSSAAKNDDAVSAAALSKVTLRIGDQAGTGAEALLTAADLINKLPFKVAWSDFPSGPPILQAIASGSLDIGGVGDAPPVFAAASGDQIAIVGALRGNPLAAAVVVPKNSPIHSVAELRGKKIAVAEGSSGDFHLLAVLKNASLTPKDATIDYLQPTEALPAFTSGHVDAWDVWSPYIEEVTTEDGARILVNGSSIGTTYAFEVASRSALADPAKAAAIKDYIKLINQAHAWANTHLSAWATVWAKATGLPYNVMLKAAGDDTETAVTITPAVINAEQKITDDFYSAGLIPTKVDFAKFSDTAFNSVVGGSS
jgi:sulfonate transport system substrate-binding protein